MQMPTKDAPASTYPFAVNSLLVASQVYIVTTGDRFTYSARIITCLIALTIVTAVLPYLVQLPTGLNYWVVFVILIPFGFFSGILQGTVFTMAAELPFKYMGAV